MGHQLGKAYIEGPAGWLGGVLLPGGRTGPPSPGGRRSRPHCREGGQEIIFLDQRGVELPVGGGDCWWQSSLPSHHQKSPLPPVPDTKSRCYIVSLHRYTVHEQIQSTESELYRMIAYFLVIVIVIKIFFLQIFLTF